MDQEKFEKFDLAEGERDNLLCRARSLCWFLLTIGEEKKAARIAESLENAEEDEISDTINILIDNIIELTSDDDSDDQKWNDLYSVLFESSPYYAESHYIPEAGEMARITRECLKGQKRIRTDVPEGCMA